MKRFNVAGMVAAIIGMLAVPAPGFAAQWAVNVTATEAIIGKLGTGKFLQILVSGTVVNPAQCSSPDSYMLYEPDLLNGALAISLTAISSGRHIRIFVTDTCDTATNRPIISTIGLM